MGFAEANQLLNSKGNPASKFENVGDSHTGVLLDVNLQVVTDPSKNNEVKYKKDGVTPQEQIVITWQTDERDPQMEGDTGIRKLYCSWRMEAAIKAAFRAAGAQGLEENARLTVTYTKDEKVKGPAGTVKAKIYEATYVSPSKLLSGFDSIEDTDPNEVAEPSSESIKIALALWDNGKGNLDVISQATGLSKKFLKDEVFAA